MIGYSLSLCIKDIIEDKVKVEDVSMIVTGTCARDDDDWVRLLDSYAGTYWRKDPVRARKIANLLRAANRIVQPRVHGGDAPTLGSTWS